MRAWTLVAMAATAATLRLFAQDAPPSPNQVDAGEPDADDPDAGEDADVPDADLPDTGADAEPTDRRGRSSADFYSAGSRGAGSGSRRAMRDASTLSIESTTLRTACPMNDGSFFK